MLIHGWGGYPLADANVLAPHSLSACRNALHTRLIPRGMGRSYGDSANASSVLQTTYFDHFIDFDDANGLVTIEAGLTIKDLLSVSIPKGWFVPVTPGTSFVTVGGAIASDVHGKNHHIAGTFSMHVRSMSLLLGTGEVVTISPTERSDLFHATCGGMGLTGIILSATLKLIPIQSASIQQTSIKTSCIEETCEAFNTHSESTYSVAWIDCVTTGKSLGRSVLMLGEHAEVGTLAMEAKKPIHLPIHTPSVLLNKYTVSAFNALYYSKATHNKTETIALQPFFYPLDAISGWNKLYGKSGFIQYQFVLPKNNGVTHMRQILSRIADTGAGSFLAVLKHFGKQNNNLLSFPMEGYTLALDFKISDQIKKLAAELDVLVRNMGGRLYLSKDALMSEQTFKMTYPRWQEFEAVREKYGAIGKFASAQSKRLGLL